MERAEFLDVLKSQLSGKMSEARIEAHVRYYQDYIQSQIKSGKKEEEVLNILGDPRLIAKTLIDTSEESEQEDSREFYSGDGTTHAFEDGASTNAAKKAISKLDLSTWYGKLIVILIAGAIIFLLAMFLTVAIPVLIVFFGALYFVSKWKKNRMK